MNTTNTTKNTKKNTTNTTNSDHVTNGLRFCSAETQITITLPIGWMQGKSEENSAYPQDIYFLSSNHQFAPQLVLQIIPIPAEEHHENSYHELADMLLAQQCQQDPSHTLKIIAQQLDQISGYPARVDVFQYLDGEMDVSITQYQACIQLETAVCGLVAMVRTAEQDHYLPVFEQATRSLVIP